MYNQVKDGKEFKEAVAAGPKEPTEGAAGRKDPVAKQYP